MNTESAVTATADVSAAMDSANSFSADRSTAIWEMSHPLSKYLDALVAAPGSARISMSIGELASAMDYAAGDSSIAVAVSAIKDKDRPGLTAVSLAALWSKWGRPTCLIDLGSGRRLLTGAVSSTKPDLVEACRMAKEGTVDGLALMHKQLPNSAMIAVGSADVLGLLSTGQLTTLVNALKAKYDRIVFLSPPIHTNFPFLGLHKCSDRLILSLRRSKSRGGPVRELAEQAMLLGMRPIDVIWYE